MPQDPDTWFLKVSASNADYYAFGTYNDSAVSFTADVETIVTSCCGMRSHLQGLLDYGTVYASKSFFDSIKYRQIYWSWSTETDSSVNAVKRGWNGIQALPREMSVLGFCLPNLIF